MDTSCRLCKGTTKLAFEHKILNKHVINYYSCQECGYFQTQTPHWLEEAYSNVINDEDTGIFRRNFFLSNFLLAWLFFQKAKLLKFLDFSGGYGILVRMLRDQGFNFKWTDKYCENIFAKNAVASLHSEKFDLITSFEVIEHIEKPLEFMNELKCLGNGNILLSTQVFEGPIPAKDWWYLGFNHGQHIGFFSASSLNKLASLSGLQLTTFRNLHLFSKNKPSKLYFVICYVLAFVGIPQVVYGILRRKSLD